ncbi:GyrI-like domain-containing protein [Epilithonimonas sp. JDS]|uniref:GyrI-like domain-containing protein n=1 Tax=Epilithonimonas sp. JDS TaxID=2902797 RepID=UPI001E62A65F|nr:GyrI-like domain-containing protein [Epilithonimonas sp. JDS]MCD9856517.1 GyrI-like domain-containing protein [Epilithonimonas sp. JDS]
MNLPHRIEIIEPKKLIGFSIITSFQEDKTPMVWRQFMMRRNEITNRISDRLFSLQIYPENFTPNQSFTKYALAEVSDFDNIPNDFESFELEKGKYLVFNYQGKAENGPQIFSYIFQTFIPENNFEVDDRPHFEIFGDDYNPSNEFAEEEIWISIK